MLIELYEESEAVRIDRESYEDAVRKLEEEAKLWEERRKFYNDEIERTIALTNEARSYEIACDIRTYVAAIETRGSSVQRKRKSHIRTGAKFSCL